MLYRRAGHIRGQVDALQKLARAAHAAGDLTLAIPRMREALALYRQNRDHSWTLGSLLVLSDMLHDAGEVAQAELAGQEAAVLARQLGNRRALGYAFQTLGKAELLQRHALTVAHRLFAESIELLRGQDIEYGVWHGVVGLARVAAAAGEPAIAARWCAAVDALSAARRHPLSGWTPEQRHSHERALAEARVALDPAAFDAAWRAGSALSLEQVIAEMRDALPRVRDSAVTLAEGETSHREVG